MFFLIGPPNLRAQPVPPGGGSGAGGGSGITNYFPSYSSNQFWLENLPSGTNAFNADPDSVTFILHATTNAAAYQLQTIPLLNDSNWTAQQTFVGANGQDWTPLTFSMSGQTALFFRAINYSQDTTESGLPDWWKIQNGLDPNSLSSGTNGVSDAYADPAGDGWSNLQKYENGWNPNTFYTPPAPLVTVTPLSGDNGVAITWQPAQGSVTGYTVFRNGVALTSLSASATSYEDNTVSVSPSSMPAYQIRANYAAGNSSLSVAQAPQSQKMAVDTTIFRGPKGQYYLAAPNIPNTVTNLRIYAEPFYSEYPNLLFNVYSQSMTYFSSTPGATYLDFPSIQFTNGMASVSQSFLPYYNAYYLICVPMGTNGTFGPAAYVMPGFFQYTSQGSNWYNAEISSLQTSINGEWGNLIPFLDGTAQLRQNLVFQLESADEVNPLQFAVSIANDTRPTAIPMNYLSDVSFLPNYAWANFHMRNSGSVGLMDEFKPFEDNYFYRNFIAQSESDLNSDGSLSSGVEYIGGSQSPPPPPYVNYSYDVQIPNAVPYAFPNYAYAMSGVTNAPTPILSTNSQSIFSTWPDYGTIGGSYNDSWGLTLASGQYNLFGLPYQSLTEYYSDGTTLHSQTYPAGATVVDVGASNGYTCFYYPQVEAPQLHTVGFYFAQMSRDNLPGDAGFTPTTNSGLMIAAAGTPLLLGAWAEQSVDGLTNTPGFIEQYFDKAYARNDDGILTTNQTGILSEYGEFFPTEPGVVVLTTKTNADGTNGAISIQVIGLYTDRNHDGTIDTSFSGPDFCTPSRPFRFWVNDDNDSGDTGGDDIPGEPASLGQIPNGASGIVNGARDLDDFFPVYVDILPVLRQMQINSTYASLQFRLSQADNALSYVETTLTTNDPLQYLTDTNQAFLLSDVATVPITSTGTILTSNFLGGISEGGGIILVEAATISTKPLVLDVLQDGYILAEAQLPISITGVEQMFRHKNLTTAVLGTIDGPQDRLTDSDVPNEPDNNGNNFAFLHGYNVNPNQARGWETEIFKRLYWSGSHAKYYGVTWHGCQSQQNLLGIVQFTPNYQTNVVNAFLTAPALASFLNGLSGTNVVAAHSMGNLVALSALSDWNANIQDYFMIDAAMPSEAIDGAAALSTNMVYPDWLPFANELWASDWHQLFPTNDSRSTLTWNNRLANFNNAQVFNFYSSGEDVLRTWPGDYPPSTFFGIVFSQIAAYFRSQSGFYAWSWQEIMKGRMDSALNNSILSSDHGGWRFNSAYGSLSVAQADALSASELQTNAFFDFSAHANFTIDLALEGIPGSSYAQANRNRVLADAIPAVTLPVGANEVARLAPSGANFDMQALYENGWASGRPVELVGASATGEWHHSDVRIVSYTYTHGLFDKFVASGNLK